MGVSAVAIGRMVGVVLVGSVLAAEAVEMEDMRAVRLGDDRSLLVGGLL